MVSHTFPGIAPVVVSTKGFDSRLDKYASGEGYSYFERNLGVAVANDALKFMLRNPSTNTKTFYLEKVLFRNTVATRVQVEAPVSPAAAAFSTDVTASIVVKKAGGAASVAQVSRVDTASDFGTSGAWYGDLVALQVLIEFLGIVLPPNSSVVFGIKVPNTTDVPIVVPEWYEE
jgi:hypothetical protein